MSSSLGVALIAVVALIIASIALFGDWTMGERQLFELCDEDANRYASAEEARAAGLKDYEFGATYCPEYKMHPSWDMDDDGINDCVRENSCGADLDYMAPRPQD